MRESIVWEPLTDKVAGTMQGKRVLAIRGDNKLYTGVVIEATTAYCVLASGNQRQVLQYGNYRYLVATYEGPKTKTPKLADPKLI